MIRSLAVRPWTLLLTATVLVLGACDGGPDPCEPETDLAFCARLGFECDEVVAFDNCEASRTVSCGMCAAPRTCGGGGATNVCGTGAPLDAGGPDAGDAVDAGTDAGAADAGPPDAGSCLAANGWPRSTLPPGYVGEGYTVGDHITPFEGVVDQRGNTDLALGQVYGAMVVVAVHAVWSPPSLTMDRTGQERSDMINAASSDYVFTQVSVLVDDGTGGATEAGGYALEFDANEWASDFGLRFPVGAGLEAYRFGQSATIAGYPTIFVLDPMFEIRARLEGFGGDPALITEVEDAWTAFRAENPTWVSTYCAE